MAGREAMRCMTGPGLNGMAGPQSASPGSNVARKGKPRGAWTMG